MANEFKHGGTHTKHKPTGEVPGFIKRSEHVGAGHTDHGERLTDFGGFPSTGKGHSDSNPGKKTSF